MECFTVQTDVNVPISKFKKSSKKYLQCNCFEIYKVSSFVKYIYAPQLNCYIISNKNHFFCYLFTILVYVYISLCTLL